MRGTENYTGTAEIAEHDAQNSFLSVFHAADYLSTARAAASREKSKSKTTQTRKANLQECTDIPGSDICIVREAQLICSRRHVQTPCRQNQLSHTRSADKSLADENM